MLAADKLLLQSEVKQRAINLRERELKLFNSNFSAVGSQSAIMAGFTLTSFVEIDLPPERAFAKGVLHFFITASVCVNFICVAMVMFVTVWGSGKALRGLDGSMDYAVDSMNDERTFIFTCFALGVLSTLGCMFAAAWVLMEARATAGEGQDMARASLPRGGGGGASAGARARERARGEGEHSRDPHTPDGRQQAGVSCSRPRPLSRRALQCAPRSFCSRRCTWSAQELPQTPPRRLPDTSRTRLPPPTPSTRLEARRDRLREPSPSLLRASSEPPPPLGWLGGPPHPQSVPVPPCRPAGVGGPTPHPPRRACFRFYVPPGEEVSFNEFKRIDPADEIARKTLRTGSASPFKGLRDE